MPAINFIGPSYALRSVAVDGQRTINMYPDINEIGNGKTQVFLTGTPGLKQYLETFNENAKIRAMFVDSKDNFYIVAGFNCINVTLDPEDGSITQRVLGVLDTDTGPVSIAENGFQLCIVDGPNIYIYIYEDDTFSSYQPEGWQGSNTVSYFSTYFVFVKPNSQQFYISKSYDGTDLDPLDFASKEGNPDNIVTTLSYNNTIWLFGTKSIEVYYNSGEEFPIKPMNGGSIQYGCSAAFSVALVDNKPVWLGRDNNGAGTIYMTNNSYQPVRISNFAIEYFIQNLDNISDATAYSYQQEGHYFYVINFPSGNTTWVYDTITQMWHERQYFNMNTAQPERHRAEYHVFWNNKHLVSDYSKNIVYEMSLDHHTDDDNPIQRIRRSPHLVGAELERISFKEFQLDLQVGNPYNLSYTPKIALRYSNDGGITWSSYIYIDLAQSGNYLKRAIWRRLGAGRNRVWEVSQSDPLPVAWIGARIIAETGI